MKVLSNKSLWLLGCLLWIAACLGCIIQAFQPETPSAMVFTGSLPLPLVSPAAKPGEGLPSLASPEMARIKQFRHYLDSLQESPAGRAHYDSLVNLRPGLFDSLRNTESLYYP
jgi:hypothetical protein